MFKCKQIFTVTTFDTFSYFIFYFFSFSLVLPSSLLLSNVIDLWVAVHTGEQTGVHPTTPLGWHSSTPTNSLDKTWGPTQPPFGWNMGENLNVYVLCCVYEGRTTWNLTTATSFHYSFVLIHLDFNLIFAVSVSEQSKYFTYTDLLKIKPLLWNTTKLVNQLEQFY